MIFEKLKDTRVAELDNVFDGMKVDFFDEPSGKW